MSNYSLFNARLARRILSNPNALEKFPALKPYAKVHQKAVASRGKSCCRGNMNERQLVNGIRQFVLSARKEDLPAIKAYMGVPADVELRVHAPSLSGGTTTRIL